MGGDIQEGEGDEDGKTPSASIRNRDSASVVRAVGTAGDVTRAGEGICKGRRGATFARAVTSGGSYDR